MRHACDHLPPSTYAMRDTRLWLVGLSVLIHSPALAQPTLDSLWPNANGLRWDYEITIHDWLDGNLFTTDTARMTLADTVETAGGTAQVLHATHAPLPFPAALALAPLDPILRRVWRARPDLRGAIAARYGGVKVASNAWWPLLLQGCYFMKSDTTIDMWQTEPTLPSEVIWRYLKSPLVVGATFELELIPSLNDSVFLRGTVVALDATVSTRDTTFANAVRMRYVVDYGWGACTNDEGDSLGACHYETRGLVHYVPNVGPVDMLEDFVHVESDSACLGCCIDPSGCPTPPGSSLQTITMSLKGHGPVGVAPTTWTGVKRRYR